MKFAFAFLFLAPMMAHADWDSTEPNPNDRDMHVTQSCPYNGQDDFYAKCTAWQARQTAEIASSRHEDLFAVGEFIRLKATPGEKIAYDMYMQEHAYKTPERNPVSTREAAKAFLVHRLKIVRIELDNLILSKSAKTKLEAHLRDMQVAIHAYEIAARLDGITGTSEQDVSPAGTQRKFRARQ